MSTYSLLELNLAIQDALYARFDQLVWVKAEIFQLNMARNGHCYLELAEKDRISNRIVAKSKAIIWAFEYRWINAHFLATTGRELAEGLSILAKVKVGYHEQYGLSLTISDIDPAFTLGELAQTRQKTLERLETEGVIDMNKELELPALPRRLAVISSETAAGWGDFHDQLHGNPQGYAFETWLFPAIMQGDKAPASLMAAFDQVHQSGMDFDAVLVLRGGGSKADLSCFDDYELAFYASQFPLPVVTGIGHERDSSVLDRVAHTALKTPTAVAEFLIGKVAEQEGWLLALEDKLASLGRLRLLTESARLKDLAHELEAAWRDRRARSGFHLRRQATGLRDGSQRLGVRADNRLRQRTQAILHAGKNLLRDARQTAQDRERELVQAGKSQIAESGRATQELLSRLRQAAAEGLATHHRRLERTSLLGRMASQKLRQEHGMALALRAERLLRLGRAALESQRKHIKLLEMGTMFADPQNLFERGFSMTLLDGRPLKNPSQAKNGDLLETRLASGILLSRVVLASPTPSPAEVHETTEQNPPTT